MSRIGSARRRESASGVVLIIYKICTAAMWREAERSGVFRGAAIDLRDGYIHFSTAAQAVETAEKHFAGERDLVLVAVDATALGESLKWEISRGGALFPHLYGTLPLSAVRRVDPLPLGPDGRHVFPELDA
jgi:uncharacterized protein (DUF952 family)